MIPAARSFFADLQKNVFSFLSGKITIDYFLKEFGSVYEMVKNTYPSRKMFNEEYMNMIDNLINQIIVGNYVFEKGQDWIHTHDNRKINLSNSSSGQQEALPMVLVLGILPFISQTHLFIIEEPEAHLFPTSQKQIVNFRADLWHHFVECGVESHMYASQWFLTLFTAKFPLFLVSQGDFFYIVVD